MKRLILIFALCGLLLPTAYGDILYREPLDFLHTLKGSKWFRDGDEKTKGKYVGEVKYGLPHGRGTITFPDGGKYVGEYKGGKHDGQGTRTYASGNKYVGGWKDGKRHGQGTLTWASGSKYVGEWKDNKWHGQGTETWASGNKYVGEYKVGKKHGQGTGTSVDGDKYVGEYKGGKHHGQGTLTWTNGDRYVGEWKDGKMHGQGTLTWANGDKSVGEFKRQAFWRGTEYNASGEVIGRQLDGMSVAACDGNQEGRSWWGTGVAVNQYHVVTNAHVLYCCKKVTVYSLPSCSNEAEPTVVSTEQKSDLGLLRLDTPLKHYATLRSGKELQLGEAVSTYDRRPEVNGCPRYVMGQGKVTKLNWMPDDSRLMVHDSPISHGSSGGPVLDASGYVVGVSAFGAFGASSSSAAIKPHWLKAFLKSNNVAYNTAPTTEELSLPEIKKKSDKFTVIIKCIP